MKIGGILSVQIQTLVFKNHFKKTPLTRRTHIEADLFPCGITVGAYYLAGLPQPKDAAPVSSI
jgi:hypothetical protein